MYKRQRQSERRVDRIDAADQIVVLRRVQKRDEILPAERKNCLLYTSDAADPSSANMATLIIVGSAETRVIERPGMSPLVYTPRSAQGAGG